MAAATFEEKELKITARVLYAIVIQTAVTVAAAVGFYFALKSDIRDTITDQKGKNELIDEKFKSVQLQNSILQKQFEGVQLQIQGLQLNIDDLRKNKK